MRNKILIYCDYGTHDIKSLYNALTEYFAPLGVEIQTTCAAEIIKEDSLSPEVLAFFMPGGRATPYLEKLKQQGNEKIAAYVNNGGIYFGICAGAYYASRNVFFETDVKELSVIQQCGLNLIDADAIGTLYKELNISPYTYDFNSMAATEIRWCADNERHLSCYHGGPYFKIKDSAKINVLAEYELNGQRLPAVVMQKYGLGAAIASGLHIEDSGRNLRRIFSYLPERSEYAEKVIGILEEKEQSRYALFNKIMQKICILR